MTMMSGATPSAMPASEKTAMTRRTPLPPGAQIAEGDETLERGKDHAPSRCRRRVER
jgi:hypothetical protein